MMSKLPEYAASWLPWAVQYFFLIGISSTTALMAASLVFSRASAPSRKLLPVALTVMAGSALALPASLLLALSAPDRDWAPTSAFAPQSSGPGGTIIVSVYVILTLAFYLAWLTSRKLPIRITGALLGLAATVALLYSGAQVMTLYDAPLWNTVFLPLLLALTGWAGAVGAMLLIGPWLRGKQESMPLDVLGRHAVAAVTLVVLGFAAWGLLSWFGLDHSYAAAHRLYIRYPDWRITVFIVVAAILASCAILTRPVWLRHGLARLPLALCLLATAWAFRWMVFSGGLGS